MVLLRSVFKKYAPLFCRCVVGEGLAPPASSLLPVRATPTLSLRTGARHPPRCHCEPVRTLVWQSTPTRDNPPHCHCEPVRATPTLSLRTSAHPYLSLRTSPQTGVAIYTDT